MAVEPFLDRLLIFIKIGCVLLQRYYNFCGDYFRFLNSLDFVRNKKLNYVVLRFLAIHIHIH